MKMPEPKAWTTMGQIRFTKPPENSIYEYAPLYDKQALIDLLDAAAQICDERANGENDAQHCADSIRSMNEKL